MARLHIPKRYQTDQRTTVMFKMSERDKESLQGHPRKCLEWLSSVSEYEPEWFRALAIRLYYVYLAARNYEEQDAIRIRALVCLNELHKLIEQKSEDSTVLLPEIVRELTGDCLDIADQMDDDLLRNWVRKHYEHATRQMFRDTRFRDFL